MSFSGFKNLLCFVSKLNLVTHIKRISQIFTHSTISTGEKNKNFTQYDLAWYVQSCLCWSGSERSLSRLFYGMTAPTRLQTYRPLNILSGLCPPWPCTKWEGISKYITRTASIPLKPKSMNNALLNSPWMLFKLLQQISRNYDQL